MVLVADEHANAMLSKEVFNVFTLRRVWQVSDVQSRARWFTHDDYNLCEKRFNALRQLFLLTRQQRETGVVFTACASPASVIIREY